MDYKDFWKAIEELSPRLFKTYAAIEQLTKNNVKYCYGSNESLGERIGKNSTNISRDISELKKLGYLWSIEIRFKGEIVGRRLYTESSYKTYMDDLENYKNLGITFQLNLGTEEQPHIVAYNEKNIDTVPKDKLKKLSRAFKEKITAFYKQLETIDKSEIAEIDNTPIAENSKTRIAENGKVIINNNNLNTNKTEKTEEPVAVSDKESKIRFIANIEKIKLDEKFIKELANKFSLEKITEWFKAVPQDKKSSNAGAYIRGIIKNQKLDSVTRPVLKKSEKVEITEEPLNTPKMSEKEIIETYLDGKALKDLDKLQLKILNDTLRRMGYEEIKPNN